MKTENEIFDKFCDEKSFDLNAKIMWNREIKNSFQFRLYILKYRWDETVESILKKFKVDSIVKFVSNKIK